MLSKIAYTSPVVVSNSVVEQPSHRIFVIDCSGSMDGDIETIRVHLKNKIPTLCKRTDFVSIVWFRGELKSDIVQEHVNVGSVEELALLNTAIDNYLDANGGTSFFRPMQIANSLSTKYPEPAQIFFMTDGDENTRSQITQDAFSSCKSSLVFVEYGYHADTDYIQKLTALADGTHIFSENFSKFSQSVDYFLSNKVNANKTVEFNCSTPCFALRNGELQIYAPDAAVCRINANASEDDLKFSGLKFNEVYTIDKSKPLEEFGCHAQYLLALWYSLVKLDSELTWALLKKSGDVYFIRKFNVCFSRQDYENLIEDVKRSLKGELAAYSCGIDTTIVPDENAFTVIDVLKVLSDDSETRVFYHNFLNLNTYSRISKKVDDEATKELKIVTYQMVPFSLSYHVARANVSLCFTLDAFRTFADGDVKHLDAYRNYAIIKDGVKHIKTLPVVTSQETFDLLQSKQVLGSSLKWEQDKLYNIDLSNIPVINQAMAKAVDGYFKDPSTLFKLYVERLMLQAERKYLNTKRKMLEGVETTKPKRRAAADADADDDDDEPTVKKTKVVSEDFYMTRELQVKIDKCASLPTVNDALLDRLDHGKPTLVQSLFNDVHGRYVEQELLHDEDPDDVKNAAMLKYVEQQSNVVSKSLDSLNEDIEKVKFAALAGRKWFNSKNSLSTGEFKVAASVKVKDVTFTGSIQLTSVRVNL